MIPLLLSSVFVKVGCRQWSCSKGFN